MDSKCPKWSTKLTFHRKFARHAPSRSLGARNGQMIGIMCDIVPTGAAGPVDPFMKMDGRKGCANIGAGFE
jgi:hypothetical protein